MKEEIKETKKPEKVEVPISINKIDLVTMNFKITGTSPLLMDKFPEEVKKQIEDKQTGKNQTKKKNRDIDKEIEQAVHKTSDGKICYPAVGFKVGLIEATSFVGDKFFSKKLLKGIQIVNAIEGLVPIQYKKKDILVRNIQSNTKHTPQFHDWECVLSIQFDKNNISAEDLANLINYAGFYYGVGIWSPRCKSGGSYGMYKLAQKI
jgi:hypothetical protein